jgi:hypothetical protein
MTIIMPSSTLITARMMISMMPILMRIRMNRSRERWRLVRHSMVYGWHVAASKRASITGVQLSRYPKFTFLTSHPFSVRSTCVLYLIQAHAVQALNK